jgi:hypothetical protein
MNIKNLLFGTGMNGALASPAGYIGIGTSTPNNKLEISSGTTTASGASGLRFTSLTSSSATTTYNGLQLSVNSSGDVVMTPDAVLANAAWSTTGNTGTTPGTNFLGTTDAQALIFKTNNTEAARILSTGAVYLGNSGSLSATTTSNILNVYGSQNINYDNPGGQYALKINSTYGLNVNAVNAGGSNGTAPAVMVTKNSTSTGIRYPQLYLSDTRSGNKGLSMWADSTTGNAYINSYDYSGSTSVGTNLILQSFGTNGGSVGIGNTAPGYLLHVGSSAYTSGTSVARFENAGGTCTVTPNVAGGITCTSDINLKKDITDVPYASSVLDMLDGVDVKSYHMLADDATAQKQTGFIAQNLQTLFPSVVATDNEGKLSVSYSAMTPILTLGVQQLNTKTKSLETRVASLETSALTQSAWKGGVVSLDSSFNGNVAFNGPVSFATDTTFAGHITVGKDTAGRVTIPAGQTTVHVAFGKAYAAVPVVTVTMQDSYDIPHKLHNVSPTGFDIDIQSPQVSDSTFNWTAIGVQ